MLGPATTAWDLGLVSIALRCEGWTGGRWSRDFSVGIGGRKGGEIEGIAWGRGRGTGFNWGN
jgi:hypothetical protein